MQIVAEPTDAVLSQRSWSTRVASKQTGVLLRNPHHGDRILVGIDKVRQFSEISGQDGDLSVATYQGILLAKLRIGH